MQAPEPNTTDGPMEAWKLGFGELLFRKSTAVHCLRLRYATFAIILFESCVRFSTSSESAREYQVSLVSQSVRHMNHRSLNKTDKVYRLHRVSVFCQFFRFRSLRRTIQRPLLINGEITWPASAILHRNTPGGFGMLEAVDRLCISRPPQVAIFYPD